MKEQDKRLIIKLWESRTPYYEILCQLPYKRLEAKEMVRELIKDGTLKKRRPPHNYNKSKRYKLCDRSYAILADIEREKPMREIARTHGVARQWVYKLRSKYKEKL